MKETIYTIPLIDAFKADDECPFCFIKRKLEQDAISFTLGTSYMEDDVRAITDQVGFCAEHYQKMYNYGNRLGTALILHTHYKMLEKELAAKIQEFSTPKSSMFSKLKKSKASLNPADNVISSWANDKVHSCYICDYMNENFDRYLHTFFYLIETNSDFMTLFKNSKGFCIPHFGNIVTLADQELSNKNKESFYKILFEKMQDNLMRIEKDLEWFIEKYDYENKDADWKTSKDAIPRGIQKLSSIYPQDPPFKEK